jgi:Na+/proline symporter
MSNQLITILSAVAYLSILFGVAYYAEYRQKKGKSVINNGYVYALSLAVYCTAWTYYGSVGQAATKGIEFLGSVYRPHYYGCIILALTKKDY